MGWPERQSLSALWGGEAGSEELEVVRKSEAWHLRRQSREKHNPENLTLRLADQFMFAALPPHSAVRLCLTEKGLFRFRGCASACSDRRNRYF